MRPSTQIGPYTVSRELGRGGMGVVYLAHDPRLDRLVAIKALPEHLASDPDRLSRFQREARVLASLSHPNIAQIYGLEESQGQQFLVLEFVDGRTLAQALEGGAMPVEDALRVGVDLAAALEAAHEQGVIHRDVKPGNVMIRPDGGVRVLDFGLARTGEAAASSPTGFASPDSPTLTSPAPVHSPTIPGAILGTAGYMSPEQARGKAVDKRSDIFSFGCVLYEMLTGECPFAGETATDALGAALHREPDWSLLPADTPPTVRLLLRRCLAKDRGARLRDIGDARIELEHAIADPGSRSLGLDLAPPAQERGRRSAATLVGAAALVALLAATIGFFWLRDAAPAATASAPLSMLTIPSRTAAYKQADEPVIAPDGRKIVFIAAGVDDEERRLWIRRLDSFEARPLPDTVNASSPFWSADSLSVAFHADGRLWSIPVEGGSRRYIAQIPSNLGASWSEDGTIILGRMGSGLVVIPPEGGTPQVVSTPDPEQDETSHVHPSFLPGGQRFLFMGLTFSPDAEIPKRSLYAGRLGSDEYTLIGEINSRGWWVESGHLVFVEDGAIRAAPFDERTARITGPATTIADDADFFRPLGSSRVSVSRSGVIAYIPAVQDHQLAWFGGDGARGADVGTRSAYGTGMRISPDGEHVAVAVVDPRTSLTDVWLYGLTRDTRMRLTRDQRWEGDPVWSPDGSTIYFAWDRFGPPDIFAIDADGRGEARLIHQTDGQIFPADITPDGSGLLLTSMLRDDSMYLVSAEDGAMHTAHPGLRVQGAFGRFSPDGSWLAYTSAETGRSQVYLSPVGGAGRRVQVSTQGGAHPVWSPDGTKLYFLESTAWRSASGSRMMVVDLTSPESFSRPEPQKLFESRESFIAFDIAPDGSRFLMMLAPEDTPPMRVVMHWQGGAK